MKIIVDSNNERFNGKVDVSEAKITSNPKIALSTTDLSTCVGLALIEKVSRDTIKRGLAHVHYRPDALTRKVNYNDAYTMVPTKEEIYKVRSGLDEFLFNFKAPRAIAVFNCFKKSKVGNLENPMANYILHYLIDNKIIFYFPGNFTDIDLSGRVQDTKTRIYQWGDSGRTDYKNMGLHQSKLLVQHMKLQRDGEGNILSGGKSLVIEEIPLDLNF